MATLRRSTVILAKSGIVHCKRTNCLPVKLSFIDLSIPVVKEKTIRKQDHISCQEMPLVLRSHLGREAYPNVFHSHSRFSGKAVHKSEMLCVRFYSHSTSKDKEEEVPFYMKYLPKFMVRKRGSATRSIDELNVIDFHEKSNLDFHVPLSVYHEAVEEIGELRTQLKYTEEALLRATAFLLVRSKIEIVESMFMVNVQQDPTSINLKDSVPRKVDKHFKNWKLIIATKKNDPAIQRMLQALIRERIDEDVFCERIAALVTSISVNIHLPNVTVPCYAFSKSIKALESMNLVDAETIKCLHAIDALSGL